MAMLKRDGDMNTEQLLVEKESAKLQHALSVSVEYLLKLRDSGITPIPEDVIDWIEDALDSVKRAALAYKAFINKK